MTGGALVARLHPGASGESFDVSFGRAGLGAGGERIKPAIVRLLPHAQRLLLDLQLALEALPPLRRLVDHALDGHVRVLDALDDPIDLLLLAQVA